MLHIDIGGGEFFNDLTNEFYYVKPRTITMEHSLLSISKWESKWKKPYLSSDSRTFEEELDYIRCMTITKDVDPLLYNNLSIDDYKKIREYCDDPHTATTITSYLPKNRRARTITSELIYCWMVSYNIPSEYEKWHINRLLTLIRVCGIENNPNGKKMSRAEVARQNAELNRARRAKYNTKG